jgi:8-oxo-dGTP pyrophosphatase MutT (NUDIX family)
MIEVKQREFTVTTYIFHEGKTLLIWHPKFHKWMPPGGHLEPNETPPEAARREVLEETGLLIEFIPDEHLQIDVSSATSLARPHFCLLEQIPAYGERPPHEHIDLIFLAKPIDLNKHAEPAHTARWFSLAEIEALQQEELFEDARQILRCFMVRL